MKLNLAIVIHAMLVLASVSHADKESPDYTDSAASGVTGASEAVTDKLHASSTTSEIPTNILDILSRTSALLHAPELYETHGLENNRPCYNASLQLTVIQSHETPLGIKVGSVKIEINETLNKITYTVQQAETASESKTAFEDAKHDAVAGCKTTHRESKRPRHCGDIQNALGPAAKSGVYRIYPYALGQDAYNHNGIEAFCDLTTDGGGWTVFQRRMEETDFQKTWNEYRVGFGDVDRSHWLGLDTISQLTQHGDFSLRIDLEDWEGAQRTATYRYFRLAGAIEKYKLFAYDYVGNAGSAMGTGNLFATKDQDNDTYDGNCAEQFHGGWWHSSCHSGNLNALYLKGNHTSYADGVNWHPWRGFHYSLKRAEMKMRARGFGLHN